MTTKNVIVFGKDPEELAQIVGITGVENNEIKATSIETNEKYYKILKELKKLNLYLSFVTNNYIKKEDIGD